MRSLGIPIRILMLSETRRLGSSGRAFNGGGFEGLEVWFWLDGWGFEDGCFLRVKCLRVVVNIMDSSSVLENVDPQHEHYKPAKTKNES